MDKEVLQKAFSRIAEQPISIVILALICYMLWQRQTELESRLLHYMEEDRQKMQKVIDSNSRAFDRNTAVIRRIESRLYDIKDERN